MRRLIIIEVFEQRISGQYLENECVLRHIHYDFEAEISYEKLGDTIVQLLEQLDDKQHKSRVICVIDTSKQLQKEVRFQNLTRSEIERVVTYQAQNYLYRDLSTYEVTYDFIELTVERQTITLSALPNTYLENYKRAFRQKGYRHYECLLRSQVLAKQLGDKQPVYTLILDTLAQMLYVAKGDKSILRTDLRGKDIALEVLRKSYFYQAKQESPVRIRVITSEGSLSKVDWVSINQEVSYIESERLIKEVILTLYRKPRCLEKKLKQAYRYLMRHETTLHRAVRWVAVMGIIGGLVLSSYLNHLMTHYQNDIAPIMARQSQYIKEQEVTPSYLEFEHIQPILLHYEKGVKLSSMRIGRDKMSWAIEGPTQACLNYVIEMEKHFEGLFIREDYKEKDRRYYTLSLGTDE